MAAIGDDRQVIPLDELTEEIAAFCAELRDSMPESSAPMLADGRLTPREHEVLRLIAEGRSNRKIADALSLSERTVENHVRHILDKLDLDSRTAAATFAVRHGLA